MATKTISLRIPVDVLDDFDAWVVRQGLNRTDAVVRFMRRPVNMPDPKSRVANNGCHHPKESLTVYGWGTVCACGARVR